MDRKDYWRAFSRDFGADVRAELLRGTLAAYPAAFEAAQGFRKDTADFYQPMHRHALMRDTLQAIAERVPGASATVRATNPPTTTYVELSCGSSILTIATSVATKSDMPRWAKHRALESAALNTDLFEAAPPVVDGAYGILLCGPEVHHGAVSHTPAFVDIGIPARDYDCYIWSHALFDEFPQVVSEFGSTPSQIEAAYLEMRRLRTDRNRTA